MDFWEVVRQPRQVLTTGFNPAQREDKKATYLSLYQKKSSVGTTDTNDGFQPGAKREDKKHHIFFPKEFRRNDRY